MQKFFKHQLQQKQADLYNKAVQRVHAHHQLISCIAQSHHEEVPADTVLPDVDTYIFDVLSLMAHACNFSKHDTCPTRMDTTHTMGDSQEQLPDGILQESLEFQRLLRHACEDFDFSIIHDMILAIKSEIVYRRHAL